MTLILELLPEEEARILADAARVGTTPAEYVLRLVRASQLPMPDPKVPLTLEEEERLLDELAGIGAHVPPLPEETYSRETLYADHD